MAQKKAPKMGRQTESVVSQMAKDAGATPKEIKGVVKFPDGRLKIADARHDTKIGMAIPRELNEAWIADAKAQGLTKTDYFEDMLLNQLKRHGWKVG